MTTCDNLLKSSDPAIAVQGLYYYASGQLILENVSMTIRPGEFVVLFGPNGGGKTTLLHLLMGFLTPDQGSIQTLGTSITLARPHMGWVPQHFRPDPLFPICVLDVVCLGLMHQSQRKKYAREALKLVGMEKFAFIPFSSLSGGEAQRVLLARALAAHPSLLFLDEPTASLDPSAQDTIYQLLSKLKGQTTIVMVTHDLRGALMLADRLLCVQGKVEEHSRDTLCHHFAQGLYHQGSLPTLQGGS